MINIEERLMRFQTAPQKGDLAVWNREKHHSVLPKGLMLQLGKVFSFMLGCGVVLE
jgi:hypothetical protein